MESLTLAARAAHDIRSPIAVMEIGLRMIESQISKKDWMIFKTAIQRIRDITNDLLDCHYSEPLSELVFIKPLLEHAVSVKRYEWLEKNQDLTLICSPDIELVKVQADSTEVARAISNLLNNAIEACTRHAKIQICVNRNDKFIEVAISDNGSGIPAKKIQHCLNGKSSKHSGKGLGLSGAKQFMENMGGELLINSRLKAGTTITLKFLIAHT